jgi:hypothetical protein
LAEVVRHDGQAGGNDDSNALEDQAAMPGVQLESPARQRAARPALGNAETAYTYGDDVSRIHKRRRAR